VLLNIIPASVADSFQQPGSHMVPLLNATGVDVACLGNHDLDFGMEQFEMLSKRCTFPWLVANVLDPGLGEGVP
jgi:5'-nucleotidase